MKESQESEFCDYMIEFAECYVVIQIKKGIQIQRVIRENVLKRK